MRTETPLFAAHFIRLIPCPTMGAFRLYWATTGRHLMRTDNNRYSALIKTRAPEALRVAVEMAAHRELTTASAYARRAIVNQLRADGFLPTAAAVA